MYRFVIAILGATMALLKQVVSRSRMRRELFYWTQKLQCELQELEQEADPFNLSTLKRWLDATHKNKKPTIKGEDGLSSSSGSSSSCCR